MADGGPGLERGAGLFEDVLGMGGRWDLHCGCFDATVSICVFRPFEHFCRRSFVLLALLSVHLRPLDTKWAAGVLFLEFPGRRRWWLLVVAEEMSRIVFCFALLSYRVGRRRRAVGDEAGTHFVWRCLRGGMDILRKVVESAVWDIRADEK